MDLAQVKRLRCNLSFHFAIIAWLTAMLVATGTRTYFLPLFIFFVSVAAYVFVDRLEWFEIGRWGSYLGMTIATTISVGYYFYNAFTVQSESGQLMAIAGLLVYPEAVLFLQRKNLRIFEQLAVFLLLEMIVAALVNDNLLFGVLLAPIMLLWVSSLFLFSRYATMVYVDPTIETPTPKLAELIYHRFVKTVMRQPQRKPLVSSVLNSTDHLHAGYGLRRTLQSIPIGMGAIAFAGLFFYLLPRTSPASLEPSIGFERRVGLPKTLSIGVVGKLLQDPTPVMRVTLTHYSSGKPYKLVDPPYLRARVMDTYSLGGTSRWSSYGEWVFRGVPERHRLHTIEAAQSMIDGGRDLVNVEFDVKRKFAPTVCAIAPAFESYRTQRIEFDYDRFNQLVAELDGSEIPSGRSLVYDLGSTAFAQGIQLPLSPAELRANDFSDSRNLFNLYRGFPTFTQTNEYRQAVLAEAQVPEQDVLGIARALESDLLSDKFSYTLDLTLPVDPELDPIEDFILNKRKGHCQYFASALLVMLRQSGIPSRIVVGYRPTEFNRLGMYFPVKQKDAHAWVEALFSRQQLLGSDLERWLGEEDAYWVRFDPTPASDGEDVAIVEQQGQTIDYVDKLWKDYVVEGQKLTGENGLYAPVSNTSEDAYQSLVDRFNNLRQRFENGTLFSGGGIGFAWPIAIAITAIGFTAILLWRLLVALPKISPTLARRLGLIRDKGAIKQAFYARCLALLESRGFRRKLSETPQEFTGAAIAHLMPKSGIDALPLRDAAGLLTSIYYRLRYSQSEELTSADQAEIETALRTIERGVKSAHAKS